MNDACVYQDKQKSGFITTAELHNISKSFKLPIKDHLLQALLKRANTNAEGHPDYRQFIGFLNWRDMPGSGLVQYLFVFVTHFPISNPPFFLFLTAK